MHEDLMKAKAMLDKDGFTCVLKNGDREYTATARGVKPLVDWLDSGADFSGFSAADKVVGKATAFLYCLLGVRAVHAGVMSISARRVLDARGIEASCDREVPGIINRRGDGPCPFEAAVWEISDPQLALAAIHAKQLEMNIR